MHMKPNSHAHVLDNLFTSPSRDWCRPAHTIPLTHLTHAAQDDSRAMTDPQIHPDREGDLALEEEPTPVAPPPMYKVIMLNDDFTPMEFVVLVLVRYFGMDNDRATAIMLEVHNRGRAVCGVFTREVAETKVMQVNDLARQNQHPLLCMMEEA